MEGEHKIISHTEAAEMAEKLVKEYCEVMASIGFPIEVGEDMLQTDEDVERTLAPVREAFWKMIEYSFSIGVGDDAIAAEPTNHE